MAFKFHLQDIFVWGEFAGDSPPRPGGRAAASVEPLYNPGNPDSDRKKFDIGYGIRVYYPKTFMRR